MFLCVYPVIVKEKLGVVDAFKRSVNIASPHLLMITLFAFVQSLVAGLGILGCCIGVLATFPAAYVCSTLVYRDLVGFSGDGATATVYPRDGGGSMPGYQAPPADPSPPPTDEPPAPPQG